VLLAVWIALGLTIPFVIASFCFAVGRALGAWRTFRRFRKRTFDGVDDLDRRVAGMERRLQAANESAVRLEGAQGRLQGTLGEARVLAGTLAEVREDVEGLVSLAPAK
jgi:hypothetical protein